MENEKEVRAAEGMNGENEQKRQLSEQELDQVSGGGNPFTDLYDIINNPVFATEGGTLNRLCRSCGFTTPHSPDVDGGYSCNYCSTKYVQPRR